MDSPPKVSCSNSSGLSPRLPNAQKLKRQEAEEQFRAEEAPDPEGWNLMGLLDHKGGIGNAARANIWALQQIVGVSRKISFPSARYPANKPEDLVVAIHGHNYLHFNPCSIGAGLLAKCEWFRRAKNIAYWAWETTKAPERWLRYEPHLAQIWVPSQFVRQSLINTGFTVPIKVIPHAIEPQAQHVFPAASEPLTFMVQFDGHSRMERKRPDLSIQAIQTAALRSGERVRIIIKTHRNESVSFGEYPNIEVEVITDWLDDRRMAELWNRVDILVSLNRGEGFGLPMVEAMARGIPVVATKWGATEEYMTLVNSFPVRPIRVEPCSDSGDAYFTTGEWAMPDVGQSISWIVEAMKSIRNGNWRRLGGVLARDTADTYSMANLISNMRAAISEL